MEVVVEIEVYGLIWVPGKGRWLEKHGSDRDFRELHECGYCPLVHSMYCNFAFPVQATGMDVCCSRANIDMAENEFRFYLGFDFLGHSVPKKEVCKRRMMKKAKVRAINVCVEDLATCLITLFLDEYGGGSRVHEYLWKVSVHLDLCITFSH